MLVDEGVNHPRDHLGHDPELDSNRLRELFRSAESKKAITIRNGGCRWVFTLGVGALTALSKSKKHFVGLNMG
jgi:hypothetical protein